MPENTSPSPPSPIVCDAALDRIGEALYDLQNECGYSRDSRGAILLAAVLVAQAIDRLTAAIRGTGENVASAKGKSR